MSFFEALFSQDGILLSVLGAGLFAAVAFGVIGSYVVVKRITYIAGAVSHSILGGIGAAFYFSTEYNIQWLTPMVGAVIAALISALLIGAVSIFSKEREDTIISVIWVTGMAAGVIFLFKTKVNVDIQDYLFGNILLVTSKDILVMGILDFIVIVAGILFYNRILSISFDDEYSKIKGVKVNLYYIFLLCVTALAIVILVRVVGIVMLIAFLTLPAAIAGRFSSSLWRMMIYASAISVLAVFCGTAVSYEAGLPTGATIVLFTAGLYLFVLFMQHLIAFFRRRSVMKKNNSSLNVDNISDKDSSYTEL